jgi:hypothetical protein
VLSPVSSANDEALLLLINRCQFQCLILGMRIQLGLWHTQASTPAACSSATQTGHGGSWLICVHMQLVHMMKIFTRSVLACNMPRASLACYEISPDVTCQNVRDANATKSSLQLRRS